MDIFVFLGGTRQLVPTSSAELSAIESKLSG